MLVVLTFSILITLLGVLFTMSSKLGKMDLLLGSSFECGFSSYFYSRFSFSIHYFMVGLIFLFLDLELCLLIPFLGDECCSLYTAIKISFLILILLLGLLMEWANKKIEWMF